MQIDFHHGVTYVCARLAGFDPPQAGIIAHSAQYVDDATNAGEIAFDNGAMYSRIASAHKMLDYRNMEELATHKVWLPFHFLPGNLGQPAASTAPELDEESYVARCVCKPNSPPARDMMMDVIRRQDRPYALHRLGIASHVFVDTWAHQGFVGFQHKVNLVKDIDADEASQQQSLLDRVKDFFGDRFDAAQSEFVGGVMPLGHGAALSYPDRPYLKWSYTNGLGARVVRDNPEDFYTAALELYRILRLYRLYGLMGPQALQLPPAPVPDAFAAVRRSLVEIDDEDGDVRHGKWLQRIKDGSFGFKEAVAYVPKGAGSWKHQALQTLAAVDPDNPRFTYAPDFLRSDWKRFHDALQVHRLYILNELLPEYGLVAA